MTLNEGLSLPPKPYLIELNGWYKASNSDHFLVSLYYEGSVGVVVTACGIAMAGVDSRRVLHDAVNRCAECQRILDELDTSAFDVTVYQSSIDLNEMPDAKSFSYNEFLDYMLEGV